MVRISDSLLFLAGAFVTAIALSGCAGTDENSLAIDNFDPAGEAIPGIESEKPTQKRKGFWFGGKNEKAKVEQTNGDAPSAEKPAPDDPPAEQPRRPRRISMGQVHMVHAQGRFVLIQAAQMKKIPPEADLMTYSPAGRPTGKLKISPEKKGNFFVADIVQGNPQPNDRVMVFVMEGADGQLNYEADPGQDGEEFLE